MTVATRGAQRLRRRRRVRAKVTGTAILSTSSGVMTGHAARAAGVGGEVVAEVW